MFFLLAFCIYCIFAFAGSYFGNVFFREIFGLLSPQFVDFSPHVTPFLIFGLLNWLFNRYLWRWIPFSTELGLFDFSGSWIGEVYHDDDTHFEAKIVIQQTFSRIFIEFSSGTFRGESFSAHIERSYRSDFVAELMYSYLFHRNSDPVGREGRKEGRSNLLLSKNSDQLEGTYFTSKGTRGRLSLKKAN